MSNLNKQAVYDLFFRIGKTAGITKIAKGGGQPTPEEIAEFESLSKLNSKERAMVAEDKLYEKYPNYYREIPRRFAAQKGTEEQANTDKTKSLNLAKARALGNLLASYRDRFDFPEQGVSFVKNYGNGIENTNLIPQLARLDSDSFDTSKNMDKYKKNPDLAKQRLDEIINQTVKYPGIKEIMEDTNKSEEDKQNAISREMNKYYGEDSNLVHYDSLPPQQPSSPTVAPVAPAESDQIIDDQGISDAVNNLVEGFNRNRGASNNVTPTQKQEIAQDTSTQQSEPGFLGSLQNQAGALGNYIKNQAGDFGNYIKNQAGDLGSAVKTQAGELSSALKNQYNQYQQEQLREQIRAQALQKAKDQALSNPDGYYYQEEDPQDTVVEQPSESNYPEISEEAIQSINPEVPATEPQASGLTTAPVAQPSTPATTQQPPDLVFTEQDLADFNSQYQKASPIDTPPVVQQAPRANNNAPVAAKPSTQANDLLFNEPKAAPRSKQNLVQEYYARSNPPNPNAKPQQFYTIKNAPSQGYDPIQGITSRISTGNFGPAPSAGSTQQGNDFLSDLTSRISTGNFGPAPSAARAAVPAARSQNRAVSAPRVARKPRPVAKPTFDRKGYGDMMSDFGYGNTSPKPIPQNLTNLMPKRTTPINSVVGPAKPLNQILSNKPTATTSPAPKPVMDTTATTKAPQQIKQSFLSQFGVY